MTESKSVRYDIQINIGKGDEGKKAWVTINLLNIEKQESEEIISAVEDLEGNIKKILTR